MKQAKYLFLDFDGVLNTDKYIRLLRERKLRSTDGFGPLFDPDAVENLGLIIEAVPSAKIVVISSWKDIHGLVGLRDMWDKRHLPGAIHSITLTLMHEQLLSANLDDPSAFRSIEGACKGREIFAWLAANDALNDPYVIIDDADGFPTALLPHLVTTDPEEGLTSENVKLVLNILSA